MAVGLLCVETNFLEINSIVYQLILALLTRPKQYVPLVGRATFFSIRPTDESIPIDKEYRTIHRWITSHYMCLGTKIYVYNFVALNYTVVCVFVRWLIRKWMSRTSY